MTHDPIVEEVRAIRAAIAKEHGYSIRKWAKALERQRDERGTNVVSSQPKRLRASQHQKKAS